MNYLLETCNTYVFGPMLPAVIFLLGGLLFFRYGSFIIFRPGVILSVLGRKNRESGISPFRTAMLALASTLGVGNIVGVSTAIFSGGPGAVFWLTVSAFAAMPLKYGEVVLAVKYREKLGNEYRGGAMYYIKKLFNKPITAGLFAVLCIVNAFTVGNVVQVKAVSEALENVFDIQPLLLGIVGCVFVFMSVYKGTARLSAITSRLIPFATLLYAFVSVFILVTNCHRLAGVAGLIVREAFSFRAALGGIGGYAIVRAVRYGVARGIMSNEAGSGTSPIAHAKSNLKEPAEQGFWGLFEVFADTVVMCNLTAFVILLSFDELVTGRGLTGMALVLAAYEKYIGTNAGVLIALSVVLFGYATVICQCFYGGECVYYLTKNRTVNTVYKIVYCLAIIYGAVANSDHLWVLTDFNISLMTVINSVCILGASGVIKKETEKYFLNKQKRA